MEKVKLFPINFWAVVIIFGFYKFNDDVWSFFI